MPPRYKPRVDSRDLGPEVRLELLRLRKGYLDIAISPADAGKVIGCYRKRERYAAWARLSSFVRRIEETYAPKENANGIEEEGLEEEQGRRDGDGG